MLNQRLINSCTIIILLFILAVGTPAWSQRHDNPGTTPQPTKGVGGVRQEAQQPRIQPQELERRYLSGMQLERPHQFLDVERFIQDFDRRYREINWEEYSRLATETRFFAERCIDNEYQPRFQQLQLQLELARQRLSDLGREAEIIAEAHRPIAIAQTSIRDYVDFIYQHLDNDNLQLHFENNNLVISDYTGLTYTPLSSDIPDSLSRVQLLLRLDGYPQEYMTGIGRVQNKLSELQQWSETIQEALERWEILHTRYNDYFNSLDSSIRVIQKAYRPNGCTQQCVPSEQARQRQERNMPSPSNPPSQREYY